MFNMGFSELLVVGVIALIFIGPQQLPEVARVIGRLLNELRRATGDFQRSFTGDITDDVQERIREARRDLHQTIAQVREPLAQPTESTEPTPDAAAVPAPETSGDTKS